MGSPAPVCLDIDHRAGRLRRLKAGDRFDLVLGFYDSDKGHANWDDYVVGVNMASLPEPGTYAVMVAGLAAVGFVARWRRG